MLKSRERYDLGIVGNQMAASAVVFGSAPHEAELNGIVGKDLRKRCRAPFTEVVSCMLTLIGLN